MNKNVLYAIALLIPGSGFMIFSHQNLQAVIFSAVCSALLTLPFILCFIDAVKKRIAKNREDEEISLGIGA